MDTIHFNQNPNNMKAFAILLLVLISYFTFAQTDTLVIQTVPQGNDFWNALLGTEFSHGYFLALLVFGFAGAFVKLLLHSAKGARSVNNGTPTFWDAGFMFRDNWKRLVLGFLMMSLFIRFYAFILGYIPSEYTVVTNFPKEVVCVLFGFFFDFIAEKLKNKFPVLQVNRTPKFI